MVGQMLQAGGVNAGSILLVDSVNNRTNGSLNAGEATAALRNALAVTANLRWSPLSSWRGQTAAGPVAAG
jgi:PBP1b-binding outer membrane lipoprotein LpoB